MLVNIYIISYILIIITLGSLAYKDYKEYILPDLLNICLALTSFALHMSIGWRIITPLSAILGAILGGGFMLLIKIIADKYYKDDSLGLGDVKLITAAGFCLGIPDIFSAITLGAFIGMFHGLILYKVKKQPLSETQVPAGVGFAIAIALTLTLRHFWLF